MAADSDIVPTPSELDKVRTYLEYEAARLPGARGYDGLLSFAVDPKVELIFGKAPPAAFASERGLIEYALAFANVETAQLPDSDQRVTSDIHWQLGISDPKGPEYWREQLRRFLSRLRADRAAAQRWVKKQLLDIWALPWGGRTAGGDLVLHFRILLRTPAALMQFVVLLLADQSRGFDLCQCKLTRCSRFFLKARPVKGGRGAPKHIYCRNEHMEEARKADAIKRAGDSRLCRAAEDLLPDLRPALRRKAVRQAFKEHPDVAAKQQLADYACTLVETARKPK